MVHIKLFYSIVSKLHKGKLIIAIPCILHETLHDAIIVTLAHKNDDNMTNAIITNVRSRDCTKLHIS